MTLKGKGMNLQVLTECACYLIFGGLLFYITYSGGYLNYVTPRMKPYLYGMALLMLLWAAVSGRYLLTPQYRVRLARSFVLIIPILLLAFRPPLPPGSSMMGAYRNSGLSMAAGKGAAGAAGGSAGQFAGGPAGQPADSPAGQPAGGPAGPLAASPSSAAGAAGGAASSQPGQDGNPWYTLNGLDTATKTITIADDDYYTWMYELSDSYEKYAGYTVIMKGFIYRDQELEKKGEFALVRLSMWCCSADLAPMGVIVKSSQKVDFKDDDWVTVTGTLGITDDGKTITLEAKSIQAAQKPKDEYVYPYF